MLRSAQSGCSKYGQHIWGACFCIQLDILFAFDDLSESNTGLGEGRNGFHSEHASWDSPSSIPSKIHDRLLAKSYVSV